MNASIPKATPRPYPPFFLLLTLSVPPSPVPVPTPTTLGSLYPVYYCVFLWLTPFWLFFPPLARVPAIMPSFKPFSTVTGRNSYSLFDIRYVTSRHDTARRC